MSEATLAVVWERRLSGELSPAEAARLADGLQIDLRALHLPNESTIGHRFLTAEQDGVESVLRVRRNFSSREIVVDLATTDASASGRDWSAELSRAEAVLGAIEGARAERNRPVVFVATPATTTGMTSRKWQKSTFAEVARTLSDFGQDLEVIPSTTILPASAPARAEALARVDVMIVLGNSPSLGVESSLATAAGAVVLILVTNKTRRIDAPTGAAVVEAPNARSAANALRSWLLDALPHARLRAAYRRNRMEELAWELPYLRADLATALGGTGAEMRDAPKVELATTLLTSPERFALATVAELWQLEQLLGRPLTASASSTVAYGDQTRTSIGHLLRTASEYLTRVELQACLKAADYNKWTPGELLLVVGASVGYRSVGGTPPRFERALDHPEEWTRLHWSLTGED
jgi:hypothetical protein